MNCPMRKPIDLWRQTNWFAIHTKPRRENFAAANVRALGIETLLPLLKVDRFASGIERMIVKPLFPGYFFARFCPEKAFESVEFSQGVLRVVSSGKFPIPVGDKIIWEIQHRVQGDGLIRINPRALAPGTPVTIRNGPFEGMMGRVERELDDRKRIAIFLETLFHTRVLIERRWVEAEAA
jgi:transcriptional antiterminator RfaH